MPNPGKSLQKPAGTLIPRDTAGAVISAPASQPRPKNPKKPGRPREFDIDKALDAAVQVFWRNGYDGASLPDLTRAMGINRPSLYAAFGNKSSLFRKALDRYLQRAADAAAHALDQPDLRDALRLYLIGGLSNSIPSQPPGCLLISGGLACARQSDPIRRELAKRRAQSEIPLRARLARAVAGAQLPHDADIDALAKFFATFKQGLAVQHTGGADARALIDAANVAIAALDATCRYRTDVTTSSGPA